MGALATAWAATAAMGFARHADGLEDPRASLACMESSYLLVQSAVLRAVAYEEGACQRAMTYMALRSVLFIAPFTTVVSRRG